MKKNKYCIEVKNYKESPLSDKIFTQVKTNNLIRWWKKLCVQAEGGLQEPLLFFKYDRSPVFVVGEDQPHNIDYLYISVIECYVMLAEAWLKHEKDMGFIDEL